MSKVNDKTMVKITIDGLKVYCTLKSFFDENNGFTKTEKKKIKEALRADEPYHGGGGAFAYWKVEADT